MNPIYLSVWMMIGAGIGAGVGAILGNVVLGTVGGALLGWPIGLAVRTRKRRWIAVASLLANYLVAWWLAGASAVLVTVGCTGITLFLSAAILRELYGSSEVEAFTHHIKILTGIFKGFHIAAEGRTLVPPNAPGPIFGPRFVIVKPDTAVLLESGTRHTEVLGPTFYISKPFEYVKTIFDLRSQLRQQSYSAVRTLDNLETTITLSTTLCVNIDSDVRTGQKQLSTVEKAILQNLQTHAIQWDTHALRVLEQVVRQCVAGNTLQQVTDAAYYQQLQSQVTNLTNQRLSDVGVRVVSLTVEKIQPAQEIASHMENEWLKQRRSENERVMETTRAQAWADAVAILAKGYRNARRENLPQDVLYREVLRRTLEQITAEPGWNAAITAQMAADFAALRRATEIGAEV